MCGFAGFLERTQQRSRDDSAALIQRMANRLTHRGPDDHGVWLNDSGTLALGHRRLAILDTSPLGHQPMSSVCGRYVVAYNGEIYNHNELRSELGPSGISFRGHSDTETLLAGFTQWGIRNSIERCIGMFAIAVWDLEQRQLTLIRDRLGIKPLYYGQCGSSLLFGSELKALRVHPDFDGEINRGSLARFLQHSYVPTPHSIYSKIHKLPAGSMLTISADSESLPAATKWWDARDVATRSLASRFSGTRDEAVERLERILADAVQQRMISDVPLGAFLSGGIDSSLVCALMQKSSDQPVRTFSIGFREDSYNEADHAKKIAQHLGTDHTEYYVTPQEALDVIPNLPEMYDEPFSDSSQIPTFLVSQLARQDVTVALSGDGGDELFGGYNRYFHIRQRWKQISHLPARRLIGRLLGLPVGLLAGRWKDRFQYRSKLLNTRSAGELYQHSNLHWPVDSEIVLNPDASDSVYWDEGAWLRAETPIEEWMWVDSVAYLPDDILTKVDRASMAVSLEVRVPVIDHRVYEFAWSLLKEWKVGVNSGKLILKDVLAKYVPRDMFERPKMGFGVPIDNWLRGPLRDWAESLLDERRLRNEGFLNPVPIRKKWNEHLTGTTDWHYHLWDVLMFQSWISGSH